MIYALTINFLIKRTCRDGNQTIHQRLQGNILTCLRSRGLVVDRAVCPRSRVLKQIDWVGDIKISQSIRSNCVREIIATVPMRWISDCGCIEGTTARGKLQVMDALGMIFDINNLHGLTSTHFKRCPFSSGNQYVFSLRHSTSLLWRLLVDGATFF